MSLDSSKVVFVTGGSGYIGRNIIREVKKAGLRVRALARSESSAKVVTDLGAEVIRGDLADTDALFNGMKEADYLIHAAADTDHGSMETAQQDESNLDGTKNVYNQAKKAGIKRAVHISSEAVLLSGIPLVNANENYPIPNKPAGGYSRTKAQAERIALDYASNDMSVMIIRPRFVWGRDDTTALPQLIAATRSGKLSWIAGGHYLISTTHIANVMKGLTLILEKGKNGEVYFITDGEPIEFRHFISQLLATQNEPEPKSEVPRWLVSSLIKMGEFLSNLTNGRITGPMSWQEYAVLGMEVTLDISKAKKELGYAPVISREQGFAELKQK